jgi:hypothetical protein
MREISWLAELTLSFLRRTLLHGVSYYEFRQNSVNNCSRRNIWNNKVGKEVQLSVVHIKSVALAGNRTRTSPHLRLLPFLLLKKRINDSSRRLWSEISIDWDTQRSSISWLERVVSFQVLTATSMKMTVFWDVASCSLIETDRRFSTYRLRRQGTSRF